MPDRDDIFGRYWLNTQRGILFTAEQVTVFTSAMVEKLRIYYGLKPVSCPQTSYAAFQRYLLTEEGGADIEARVSRSHEAPGREFLSAEPAAGDNLFHDKAHIEHRFAGHAADPVCGVTMRQIIEGGLVAFRLNQEEFWRLKTQAHARGIRFAMSLPLLPLAGGLLGCVAQFALADFGGDATNLLYLAVAALPVLGLIAGLVFAAMHKGGAFADHEKWTAGIASVSRRNARQIETDLAGQRAYLQGLIDELTLHGGMCMDEVRIDGGKLASAVAQKAFLGRVARLLAAVLAGYYDYQRICHYFIIQIREAVESRTLYRAFYFDFGPAIRVPKGLLRLPGLGFMMTAAIGGCAAWWWLTPSRGNWQSLVGPGITLACGLASIAYAAGLMKVFDGWLREGLSPGLMTDLTGGGASPDGSGPSSGGPSSGLSPEGYLENRLFETEHHEAVKQLAEEERRRLR
jgi:hypothetical protein